MGMNTKQMKSLAKYWKANFDGQTHAVVQAHFNEDESQVPQTIDVHMYRRFMSGGPLAKMTDSAVNPALPAAVRSICMTAIRLLDDNSLAFDLGIDGAMLTALVSSGVLDATDQAAAESLGVKLVPLRSTLTPPCDFVTGGHLHQIEVKGLEGITHP